MKSVVIPTVLELLSNLATDFYSVIWGYRDVATIKQDMHVVTEEESVINVVRSVLSKWLDVRIL